MDIKLSDDEIVKALECCINECDCENCPYGNNDDCMANVEHILDLINRQKEEIERLTEKTKSQLVLNQTIQTLNEKILAENAELQQQVADLKERAKIDLENEKNWGKIQTKQAVKDTAKEILQGLVEKAYSNECIDLTVNEVKAWFREDYGVEME